ncbi:PPR repeat, partial [Musa troglodytarum]
NQLCLCLRDTSITFGHPLKCLEDFAFEWMVIMLTHWTFCFPECFKLLWCHDPEGGLYGLVDWTILRCAEPVFHVMAPTGFNAETFGVIQRRDGLQLGYFNGPWIARIFLVTVAIWWSLSEIARLHLFKRTALLQHCMAEKRESGTPRQVRNRDHRFFDEAKNGGKAKKVNRYTNAMIDKRLLRRLHWLVSSVHFVFY